MKDNIELIILGVSMGKQHIIVCKYIFEKLREIDANFNYLQSEKSYRIYNKKESLFKDLIKDIKING